MELVARSPYVFEILQIEAIALFFVLSSIALLTWNAFRDDRIPFLMDRGFGVSLLATSFGILALSLTLSMGLEYFLLAVGIALGLVLSIIRPINSLAFFISMQLLRPWEVLTDIPLLSALPRASGLIVIAGAIGVRARSSRRPWRLGRGQWFLLGFAAWAFLSTFFSPSPADAQKEFVDGFLRAIVIFFLITAIVSEKTDLRLLRDVFLWSVMGLASVSLFLSWDQIGAPVGDNRLKAVGTIENANDIAAIIVVAVPFMLRKVFLGRRNIFLWASSLFFFIVTLLSLYLAQSRGALLALAVEFLGWLILRSKNRMRALMVAVFLIAVIVPFSNEILRRDVAELQESSDSRIIYWRAGLQMALRSPLFGVGFNRYPLEYESYVTGAKIYEFGERTAHSTWVLALAETGVPGFLLFVCFVLSLAWMAKRIFGKEPDLFAALMAYLVAVSFLSHTWLIYLYILGGFVVAGFRLHYRTNRGWAI